MAIQSRSCKPSTNRHSMVDLFAKRPIGIVAVFSGAYIHCQHNRAKLLHVVDTLPRMWNGFWEIPMIYPLHKSHEPAVVNIGTTHADSISTAKECSNSWNETQIKYDNFDQNIFKNHPLPGQLVASHTRKQLANYIDVNTDWVPPHTCNSHV